MRELADLRGPVGFGGVHDEFRAELEGEGAFGVAGGGGDDVRAEFAGDLNGGAADAAGGADDEHPVAGFHLDAVGEHVHGGAAGEGEGGGGDLIHSGGQGEEGAGGDDDFFREATVALDAEELTVEADGFLALPAEFTGAAKDVGLDGDAVTDAPLIDVVPRASISPATSQPGMRGSVMGMGSAPASHQRSRRLRPQARTRTRTSSAAGMGSGRSQRVRVPGLPWARIWTAFMRGI